VTVLLNARLNPPSLKHLAGTDVESLVPDPAFFPDPAVRTLVKQGFEILSNRILALLGSHALAALRPVTKSPLSMSYTTEQRVLLAPVRGAPVHTNVHSGRHGRNSRIELSSVGPAWSTSTFVPQAWRLHDKIGIEPAGRLVDHTVNVCSSLLCAS